MNICVGVLLGLCDGYMPTTNIKCYHSEPHEYKSGCYGKGHLCSYTCVKIDGDG